MPDEELELNFGEPQERVPVAENDYEMEIQSVTRKPATETRREQIVFTFKIREDVLQKEKGRYVFYSIGKKEEDGKLFNFYRLNQIILSQKGTEGYKERFVHGLDELFQYLQGRHLKCYVSVIEGAYKPFNSVDGDSIKPSEWDKEHPVQEKEKAESGSRNLDNYDIPDSDLPF